MGGGKLVVGLLWYQVSTDFNDSQISHYLHKPLFLRWCTIIWRFGGPRRRKASFFFTFKIIIIINIFIIIIYFFGYLNISLG
jgi:hypothetical protein